MTIVQASIAPADPSGRKPIGRPRDPAIDEAVRAAATRLMAEGGYRALSFDTISQMTGIPRSMIYRRWPSKLHIASEIAIGGDDDLPDLIDAEGLEAQILALVRQILARYRDPAIAAASVGVIADSQGDRALQHELRGAPELRQRAVLDAIVARGQAAGLIRADASAEILFDTLVGTLVYRVLFSLKPVPGDYAEALSRALLVGLRATV